MVVVALTLQNGYYPPGLGPSLTGPPNNHKETKIRGHHSHRTCQDLPKDTRLLLHLQTTLKGSR